MRSIFDHINRITPVSYNEKCRRKFADIIQEHKKKALVHTSVIDYCSIIFHACPADKIDFHAKLVSYTICLTTDGNERDEDNDELYDKQEEDERINFDIMNWMY